MSAVVVSGLSLTPVKGMRLQSAEEIELGHFCSEALHRYDHKQTRERVTMPIALGPAFQSTTLCLPTIVIMFQKAI